MVDKIVGRDGTREKLQPILEIRPATLQDLDVVWKMVEICSDWLVTKGFDHWKKYYSKELVEKKLKTQEVFIGSLDDNPVATVTMDMNPVDYYTPEDMSRFANQNAMAVYITALAVLPEKQGAGLASQMMQMVEGKTREKGAKYLRLDCRESYQDLVRFYANRGFVTVGRIIDEADNNEPYLLMEKELTDL